MIHARFHVDEELEPGTVLVSEDDWKLVAQAVSWLRELRSDTVINLTVPGLLDMKVQKLVVDLDEEGL